MATIKIFTEPKFLAPIWTATITELDVTATYSPVATIERADFTNYELVILTFTVDDLDNTIDNLATLLYSNDALYGMPGISGEE